MDNRTIARTVDLAKQPVILDYVRAGFFQNDIQAHSWVITVLDNGEAADLTGCSATGYAFRSAGDNPLTISTDYTSISGNVVTLIFPQAVYAYAGSLKLICKISNGTTTYVVDAFVTDVAESNLSGAVSPGTAIPGLSELPQTIISCQTATTAANTAATAANTAATNVGTNLAATYDATATYAVGDYCIYNGALYRCTTAITTAEAWTAGHWTAVTMTGEYAGVTEKTRNLFDKKHYKVAATSTTSFFIGTDGVTSSGAIETYSPRMVYIGIEPNKTYTVCKSTVTKMRIATFTVEPLAANLAATAYAIHSTASADKLTVTSGANDKYLAVQLFISSTPAELQSIEANIGDLQIEEGSVATAYVYAYTAVDSQAREDIEVLIDRSEYNDVTGVANVVRTHTLAQNKRLFPIGDQLIVPWKDMDDSNHNTDATAYQVAFDIVHHGMVTKRVNNEDVVVPGLFLQQHLASAYGVQFSHNQAFYQASTSLAAGTYNVTFGVKYNGTFAAGTTGQFTLTQALPAGGRLLLTNNTVEAWASATATAYNESVALTVGTDGTNLGTISSATAVSSDGLNAMQRITSAHNRWSTSALRQYLNSTGTGWFASAETFDLRPDEYAKNAFLTGFSADFLAAINAVKVTTLLNTTEGFTDTSEDSYDTFFLPSLEQMNITPETSGVEGEYFEYWREALGLSGYASTSTTYDAFKIPAINSASAQFTRLRSAYRANDKSTWLLYSSGRPSSSDANAAHRFTPVCVIC